MHIRIPHNQTRQRISHPVRMSKILRQCLKCNQERNSPHLTHETDDEALIQFLGDPGPELELENEEDAGGDDEEVGVECGEAEGLEG